jgi:hypothetical protein
MVKALGGLVRLQGCSVSHDRSHGARCSDRARWAARTSCEERTASLSGRLTETSQVSIITSREGFQNEEMSC